VRAVLYTDREQMEVSQPSRARNNAAADRITPCWREGCTKKMRNGRDHAGMCNVVMDFGKHNRRRLKTNSFALLDELPADLLTVVAGRCSAAGLLCLEQCSRRLLSALRGAEKLLWDAQLEGLLFEEPLPQPVQVGRPRVLFRGLKMRLEVRGWEDPNVPEADNNAWWRCCAVGLRLGPCGRSHGHLPGEACGSVRVRYVGYRDEDDEWRSACSVRPASLTVDPRFLATPRAAGEAVEVSAKPRPGHPSALWESTVLQVVGPRGNQVPKAAGAENAPNRGHSVLIHYNGFEEIWDEWIAADSKRIRAAYGFGAGTVRSLLAECL
jgi:hypothetical protein